MYKWSCSSSQSSESLRSNSSLETDLMRQCLTQPRNEDSCSKVSAPFMPLFVTFRRLCATPLEQLSGVYRRNLLMTSGMAPLSPSSVLAFHGCQRGGGVSGPEEVEALHEDLSFGFELRSLSRLQIADQPSGCAYSAETYLKPRTGSRVSMTQSRHR